MNPKPRLQVAWEGSKQRLTQLQSISSMMYFSRTSEAKNTAFDVGISTQCFVKVTRALSEDSFKTTYLIPPLQPQPRLQQREVSSSLQTNIVAINLIASQPPVQLQLQGSCKYIWMHDKVNFFTLGIS